MTAGLPHVPIDSQGSPAWQIRRWPPAEPPEERPPRSLDDVDFQNELDDLQDPLGDEQFFRSTLFSWVVAIVSGMAASAPLAYVVWRFYGTFAKLIDAFAAGGAPTVAP